MMKHAFFVLMAAVVLTACDDTPKRVMPKGRTAIIPEKDFPKDKEIPIDIPPPPAPYTGPKKYCFEMEIGTDPIEMTELKFVLDDNDSIRGTLEYLFAGRMPVKGKVEGLKEGKFIELGYTYSDSGVVKRELMELKMEGDKIYKKNGTLVEQDGVWMLENPLLARLELFVIQTECK
jgi:hypothetical protein